MKTLTVIAICSLLTLAEPAHAGCPATTPNAILIGQGGGGRPSGMAVLYGAPKTINVIGNLDVPLVIFIGVGGGGEGGTAGGSGFAGGANDNGGGGGGAAGAPVLAFFVTATRGDVFNVELGTGG